MLDADARRALESMMRATEDDATPIIRRLARIQARHVLDASAGGDAIPAGERSEAHTDAWNDFVGEYLTDGKGYAAADVWERCEAAFDAGWSVGPEAALHRAIAALALPAPVMEGDAERLANALRSVRDDLHNENGLNLHSITDTIWHGPGETTVDFIDATLAALSEGRSHG